MALVTTKTDKITAVLGYLPGYDRSPSTNFKPNQKDVATLYQEIAEKNYQTLKSALGQEVYVSAVITESTTVYRKEWGCPDLGEQTFTIECTRNPVFIDDSEQYKRMAEKNILDLKKALNQCTVLIEYAKVEVAYVTNDTPITE